MDLKKCCDINYLKRKTTHELHDIGSKAYSPIFEEGGEGNSQGLSPNVCT